MSLDFANGKKGFEILGAWVEVSFIVLIAAGALIGYLIKSVLVSYVVLFLLSLVSGTFLYNYKRDFLTHYVILSGGFVIGYLAGNRAANPWILAVIFIAGNMASYQAFSRKLLKA